jgi:hypothetical protein
MRAGPIVIFQAKKNALRELKRRRRAPWFAFLGLIFFSVNIFTAIEAGTVYGAWPPHVMTISYHDPSWLTHAMTISHRDHPAVYILILSISVVAVPFFGGMLYSYYFKKIPD